jgi:hypothetical protein
MAEISNPIVALTEQDFLDLIDRVFPEHYLAPLKSPGPGYEILQAYAKIFARASRAIEIAGQNAQIATAASGSKATGTVFLSRPSPHPDGIAVVVKAGSTVTCSIGGQDFVTLQDVAFGPTDLGPFSVPIQAISVGYEWNVKGSVLTASGETLPGEIDTIKVLIEAPDYGDTTITVSQTTDTTGGTDAALDALGSDRGLLRLVNETDAAYRARLRALPDTVSPEAFFRVITTLLGTYGAGFDIIETWQITYQTCWDAPTQTISGSLYDPNLFCYDDPRNPYPFRNRWLDESDFRGGIVVVVESIQPLIDTGMVWDDAAINAAALMSVASGGKRSVGAWDVPSNLGFGFLQGGFDGFDLQLQSVYKGLLDTLRQIVAAGAAVAVEQRGQ